MTTPSRGEVWMTDFGQTRGREQAGPRPALVISKDAFNQSGAELAIVLPVTSRAKRIRSHVVVQPPEGGFSVPSHIKCEDIRSISHERLLRRLGTVMPATLVAVEDRLRILLGL